MTAEEIRNGLDYKKGTWFGNSLYVASFGCTPIILVEIAAQLAEYNEREAKKDSGQ